MKKIIYTVVVMLVCISASAQQDTIKNKKGYSYLPKEGDIAIGADMLPYLNYLGNMFNGTENNTLDLGSQNLYFRYYLSEETAVRLNLSIGNTTENSSYYTVDDAARANDPLSQDFVEDKESYNYNDIAVLVGLQKSRGYGRLKGYYGAQIGYVYSNSSTEYYYGNNFTQDNQNPSNHWGFNGERTTEIQYGAENTVAAGGFIGVEYYILPKICIGGEYSLMYNYTWGSQANTTSQDWIAGEIKTIETPTSPGNTSNGINTMRPGSYGGLFLMFHF